MKFVPGFLATVAISGVICVSAAAAEQPITVMIDQQKLNLSTSAPVKDQGSILVPMRPIFEKLGLTLVWDSKTGTITATKEDLTIILQLGSKKATVNGTVKQLAAAPKMIHNVTYVPLRFVGEATGKSVAWNAKANSVEIKSSLNSTDDKGISELFDKYISFSNKEDYNGFISLIDPKSPLAAAATAFKEQMAAYDTTTAIAKMDIIDIQEKEATVDVVETVDRTGGAFTPNSTAEYIYSLTKNPTSSSWMISNVQIKALQYSLPAGALEANIPVPAADEAQIKAAMQANTDYTNKEDLNGVLSTIDESSPAYELSKQTYKQLFDAYDLQSSLESSKIIYYKDNEAAIYAVMTTKKLKGPQFTDNRSETVTTVKKSADGKWKLVQTYSLSAKPLTN
ncbi:Protease inhibitor precursor [compost metagenome]